MIYEIKEMPASSSIVKRTAGNIMLKYTDMSAF